MILSVNVFIFPSPLLSEINEIKTHTHKHALNAYCVLDNVLGYDR